MRKNGGYAILIFVILVIVVATVGYVILSKISSSPNGVTLGVEVNPKTFKVSDSTTLKVQLKNEDDDKVHVVLLEFTTNQLVHISLGTKELPSENSNGAIYVYTMLLQPGQVTTQPLTVKVPELPVGIPHQDFYVEVAASIDGTKQNGLERKVTFTAESN